jgi:hypothetical protein
MALKPPAAIPSRSRIVSEDDYYADITALRSSTPPPPLPPDAAAQMDQAFAGLAAIFANAPPRKPGRHPLSPGMALGGVLLGTDEVIEVLRSWGTVRCCRQW